MPQVEGGVVATRPLRLVLLPGLDATGSQHAAFSAAMQRLGVVVTVIAYPVNRTLDYPALASFVRQALPTEGDYLLFDRRYVADLMDLGYQDTLRGRARIETFFAAGS